MDNLQSELAELKGFIADLKAERAAAKEKEKSEAWTKWVSLSVVIIAVIASIAGQRAGKAGGGVEMSQAQASDLWNEYQAQSIKQHLFEAMRQQSMSAAGPTAAQQKDYDAKIADYTKRKNDLSDRAKQLEKARDASAHMAGRLGSAGSCFTISIAIASICLMTKKKPLWIVSMLLAAAGILIWSGLFDHALSQIS